MFDTLKKIVKSVFGGTQAGAAGGAAQTAGSVGGDSITATATTETGKEKQAGILLANPTVKAVKWGMHIREKKLVKGKWTVNTIEAREISKTANGVTSRIFIETQGASGRAKPTHALIILESDAWGGEFIVRDIYINKSDKEVMLEQDVYEFVPDKDLWKDTSKKTAKISATVYLYTYLNDQWLVVDRPECLAMDFHPGLTSDYKPSTGRIWGRVHLHGSAKAEIDFDYCSHGMEYREEIFTVKYGSQYGPKYNGKTPMINYSNWDALLSEGKITADEKKIISVVAENEGKFEAVHSYDSEVVSVGAMQKTVGSGHPTPIGEGELTQQIYEFMTNNPEVWDKYKCCFEHYEWTFEKDKNRYYTKFKGELASPTAKNDIRKEHGSSNSGKTSEKGSAMEPFVKLAHDADYHDKQVLDFIPRMKEGLSKKMKNYDNREVSEYVKSLLGKATVLDHSINRPNHVNGAFSASLDDFFAMDDYKELDKDPSTWGTDHAKYEKEILDIYGPKRGVFGTNPMTDAKGRYDKMKAKL